MKKYVDLHRFPPLILIVCLGTAIAAQNVWEQSYLKWTKNDVERVINSSPWVKTQEEHMGGVSMTPFSYKVILRLRSAMPIRQALVRLNQLNAKYDKMSETEKAAFDVKTRGLLECPACTLNYVITLNSPITRGPGDDVVSVLKSESVASLKPYVYLANEKGEKRELIHFVPPKAPGDEAMFFFPRGDSKDQPLLTPNSKKLIFFIESRVFERYRFPFDKMEFDVARLLLNGEVAF